MKKFGQEVILKITDKNGRAILDATGLRVDFDVREVDGFSRASISIYNLNEESIANLIGGNADHYATVTTRLHGSQEFVVISNFFISNTITENKIPNVITTLYCYSKGKEILEKQVNIEEVNQPKLENLITALLLDAGYQGRVRYQCFPSNQQEYIPPRPKAPLIGSVNQCLNDLKREHGFLSYTRPDEFLFVYTPNLAQVPLTELDNLQPVVLNTSNMRANPKLAPAQLQVVSNLDGNIEPGAVLDISQLLTAGTSQDEQTLQIAKDFARKSIAGYSRYQTLVVQHKGSNYTSEWQTQATAVAPLDGLAMPTTHWFR